ncbi:hypothetical protein PIB30_088510 [Stylosanthes scabra]|uniref:Uncharacterized protein n=1 Tax=Stylosanthes scabra TaxID=79078 RepID=A0ABU6RTM1_9FABA|nr:hypothetical protein [Stylosanthes scabra]
MLRKLKKQAKQQAANEVFEEVAQNNMVAEDRNEQRRTLGDYTIPSTASCDSSAGGSLQLKTPEEAMELIELVANNQYMFTSDRNMKRGVMEVDTMDAILA